MKIDTHRHLGGSIPPDCIWDIINNKKLYHLAETYIDVIKAMTFKPTEKYNFHRFLNKFKILDHIPWDEETIAQTIQSVCKELETEQIDYCWMDLSINKYMDGPLKWSKIEASKFIYDCFRQYRPDKVGLILSLKYEALKSGQTRYARLIDDIADIFIGIDLVGDEEYFDAAFYKPIFRQWKKAGKILRAHVAESQQAENGILAIEELGVTNIAHGIKMAQHPYMLDIAKDHNITFDLGLTSNKLIGLWDGISEHPITALLKHGQKITLGTDDPVQCSTTLDMEFNIARDICNISNNDCIKMSQVAINNSISIIK